LKASKSKELFVVDVIVELPQAEKVWEWNAMGCMFAI